MILEEIKEQIEILNGKYNFEEQQQIAFELIDYLLDLEESNPTIGTLNITKVNNSTKYIYETKRFECVLSILKDQHNHPIAYEGHYMDLRLSQTININTFHKLPLWFKLSCMTISRANSGKYKLTKKDQKNGYYLTLTYEGINLKVPFKSLFDSNNKLDGIPSISFSTAKECPSQKLGLCQLTDHNLCYALRGEKQANGIYTDRGFLKLNSYYKTVLDFEFIKTIKANYKKLNKLYKYIKSNFEVVRFNKKGDFKNKYDYLFIEIMALCCPNVDFYGYTARDDLFQNFEFNKTPTNLYLNGSNKIYTNWFITTTNLKDYLNSGYKCLGDCKRCKKCYTLQRKFIKCLLHGSNTDMYFNTFDNREFLITFFNNNFKGLNLSHRDLKANKGLLSSLNKAFKNSMYKEWNFKDYKELTNYIYTMGW